MDLTTGPVGRKLFLFFLPIMLGNVLQTLYSAADKVVVGQFAENGALALAAVGGTTSAIYLMIGLFNGLAVGANVICANLMGARKDKELRQAMHTAVLMAAFCGLGIGLFGFFACNRILQLMSTPADVLEPATLYMRIYFLGAPASLVYNFGAAVLRSYGDTKRPMYILMVSGLVNVVLNLLLVMGFHMSVDGVAIATIASQLVSAVWVLWILFNPKDQYGLRVKELKIHGKPLLDIIRVGVPSGIGGMVFSISNTLIQSTVNGFDNAALLAGKSVVADITGVMFQVMAAMNAATVSFAGQCYGARKYKRIDQLTLWAMVQVWILMGVFILLTVVFADFAVGIFNSDPDVIRYGALLLYIECPGFMIYIPSEIFLGCNRGMKRALMPTILNLIGICVTRLIWIWAIFPLKPEVWMLFLCYPVSWVISTILQGAYYFYIRRKIRRADPQ